MLVLFRICKAYRKKIKSPIHPSPSRRYPCPFTLHHHKTMVAMLILVLACLLTTLSACLESEHTDARPLTILDVRATQKTYVVVAMVESHMFARIESGGVGHAN
jgi:hypothetical protein